MERSEKAYVAHCLVLAFPIQGHINPMVQFSKRLDQKGVRVTFASTRFFLNTVPVKIVTSNNNSIALDTISDGFDEGGEAAESAEAYMDSFWRVGSQTLEELLHKLASSGNAIDCVVYDAFMPWALDVAKRHGIRCAAFFTQSCAVQSIYYHAYQKVLKLPVSEEETISLPGLPQLSPSDLPSFLGRINGTYSLILDKLLDQFANIERADWVLANTFYELEQEVVEFLRKIWPLKTIGPTVPSMFIDERIQEDRDYGISVYKQNSEACMKWLDDKPKRSVVYVAFGSVAALDETQMEELAWGLKESECYFLWVVRSSEEAKVPKDFASEKGLMVTWCPQLQVLSHEAVGCFVTHCGWNSTLEALCLGVPIVGVPQWSDQCTNAKWIRDVWKVGITVSVDEKGVFTRQVLKQCIREVLESERGIELKNNTIYWGNMARKAVDEGGSSDRDIEEFVGRLVHSKQKYMKFLAILTFRILVKKM